MDENDLRLDGNGVAGMLATQIATAGRGYGLWTPALIGLMAAIAGFGIVLAARGGRRLSVEAGA